MAHDSSARDLLRASVTDGDAVRRYLTSIEPHELSQLLDGLSSYHKEKQQQPQLPHLKSVVLVQDDWLPLLRLLVQCETTRLRTASHVLHALRRGRPSELESMQLLTEVSVGYSSALDRLQELQKTETTRRMVQRQTLLDEVHTVLDTVFCFLEEEVVVAAVSDGPVIGRESSGERSGNSVSCCSHRVRSNDKVKLLPQLLGLVSFFLGLCGELQTRGEQGKSGTLARLLELPWDCCTVPSLLDVLADDASLMSRESWQGLQETVERLVTSSTEMASETMNPMIRECVTVASVTGEHKWIAVARYLLQQLPVQLRQEAEFNLQMSLRHSQCIVSLICESIRSSRIPGVVPEDADSQCNDPQCSSADVRLEIEHLAWLIVHSDVRAFVDYASTKETQSRSGGKTLEKYVLDQVGLVLNFGGKQVHAREWKALLLMDIVFYWIEQSNTTCAGDKPATAKSATALMLLQAIFETAPEARFEVLSSLFERSQKPAQRKIAGEILSQLFVSHSAKLFPHLNAIQDWLSMQFHRSFDSARDFFLIASNLATVYKDLYNFLMVFLRKLLSTGNRLHQQYVVDMWCTWLDRQLPFNEQQEEEIVSALINSMIASRDIQAWSFGRLAQVFNCRGGIVEGPVILLRKSSWEKFYRFLSQEVGKFLLPTTSGIMEYGIEEEEDSADENDDDDMGLQRFRVTALDAFYQQNASLDGAASTGLIFQKLLSCLIAFENGICRSKVSSEGLPIEGLSENDSDIKQWFIDLVSSWKYFFHWLCQDSEVLLNQPAQGYFLDDVKDYVQLDGFTKTSVSCASLCKRLLDNTAEMVDPAVDCVELCKLSSLAYDILCENVVYNARLLRLLMNICLPTHLALHIQTFVTLESKIEAFIQTCGIHSAEHVEISTSEDCHQRRPALAKTERRSGASACRKRLRQRPGVRSPYSSGVDSDSDFDASYPSDSDFLDCVPHLQSHATQRIAIGTVLAALEQSQSTLLHLVTTKNKDKEAIDHEALLGYIRIHEVVNKAISANVDFLWETRKVLLKVLHMIELGLRIGKAIGALQRRRDDLEVKWHDTAICIYEFSVTSALRNRIWAGGIKDASEDAETKTKISATLLKTDIFLLQAPGIVQTWLKETSIPSSTKERLKSLMTMVKDRIAPTSLSHARRGKAKARQRLLGVVPIVRKRKKRLRSRHPVIDAFLNEEDGADAFADLEDFIE
ncbi:unnamed protein product [Hyaloperonospora brassicae]|uniref:Telomere-associated protein Rif1 N-terminal domain-containing protein n=1 Tax=Hyaloperonospora brassicae TaxID=162125 RepID=A0AAV0TY86_HYABA|nr:unnamed protein product [Hyaloperonospora brassicae]